MCNTELIELNQLIRILQKLDGTFDIDPVSCFEVQVNIYPKEGSGDIFKIEHDDITKLMKLLIEAKVYEDRIYRIGQLCNDCCTLCDAQCLAYGQKNIDTENGCDKCSVEKLDKQVKELKEELKEEKHAHRYCIARFEEVQDDKKECHLRLEKLETELAEAQKQVCMKPHWTGCVSRETYDRHVKELNEKIKELTDMMLTLFKNSKGKNK